jgi:hypothetical protein
LAYLKIKNALVAENDKEAALAGKDLVNAFDKIANSSVTTEEISEFNEIIVDARGLRIMYQRTKGKLTSKGYTS